MIRNMDQSHKQCFNLPGSVFELADLLGGPGGQGLGFLHLGAAALGQQTLDGLFLQHGHDGCGKGCAQVPAQHTRER